MVGASSEVLVVALRSVAQFALLDNTFQVSDESALSIYERGPKVGFRDTCISCLFYWLGL